MQIIFWNQVEYILQEFEEFTFQLYAGVDLFEVIAGRGESGKHILRNHLQRRKDSHYSLDETSSAHRHTMMVQVLVFFCQGRG